MHAVLSEILPPFQRPFASHVKVHGFTGWFRSKVNISFNMQKHNTKSEYEMGEESQNGVTCTVFQALECVNCTNIINLGSYIIPSHITQYL